MGDLFYLVQGKRAAQEGLFPVGEPLLDDLVAPDVIAQQETSNEMFQSSPGPKAGCFLSSVGDSAAYASFNPHPARKPGASVISKIYIPFNHVSILTRPESRVLLLSETQYTHKYIVSTLTRPESRVLRSAFPGRFLPG